MPDTKYTKKLRSDPESRKLKFKKSDIFAKNGLGEEQPYLACEDKVKFTEGDCIDRNVYVLTSGRTASAADRLVSILKDNSAAVVIGTNTGGEGRMDSFLIIFLNQTVDKVYSLIKPCAARQLRQSRSKKAVQY